MRTTPNNTIPYAAQGLIDPAASLNLALDTVDALLQLEVLNIQNDPPGSAINGDRYLVGTGSGAWSGKDGQLARYVADPGY
ncbi:DUF2793 domain-containing protein [Microbulbifer sp. VAAC004]|uniref:DUF2793 domain-containing protein n=1 Tax=Microbulbifer sp. VAAC004 TaxID=3243385 RepID=UPI00403A176E